MLVKNHLKPAQQDIARVVKETIASLKGRKDTSDDHFLKQREEIVRALTDSKGRVAGADGAAVRMGINRTTLLSRIKKLRIDPSMPELLGPGSETISF